MLTRRKRWSPGYRRLSNERKPWPSQCEPAATATHWRSGRASTGSLGNSSDWGRFLLSALSPLVLTVAHPPAPVSSCAFTAPSSTLRISRCAQRDPGDHWAGWLVAHGSVVSGFEPDVAPPDHGLGRPAVPAHPGVVVVDLQGDVASASEQTCHGLRVIVRVGERAGFELVQLHSVH